MAPEMIAPGLQMLRWELGSRRALQLGPGLWSLIAFGAVRILHISISTRARSAWTHLGHWPGPGPIPATDYAEGSGKQALTTPGLRLELGIRGVCAGHRPAASVGVHQWQ